MPKKGKKKPSSPSSDYEVSRLILDVQGSFRLFMGVVETPSLVFIKTKTFPYQDMALSKKDGKLAQGWIDSFNAFAVQMSMSRTVIFMDMDTGQLVRLSNGQYELLCEMKESGNQEGDL